LWFKCACAFHLRKEKGLALSADAKKAEVEWVEVRGKEMRQEVGKREDRLRCALHSPQNGQHCACMPPLPTRASAPQSRTPAIIE
jgi:hypothetical protein